MPTFTRQERLKSQKAISALFKGISNAGGVD
jgi:hypothetical protein